MSNSAWAGEAALPLGRRQPHNRAIGATSVGFWSLVIEAGIIVLVSVTSGVAFHLVTRNEYGDVNVFLATGAITAAFYCSLVRMWGATPSSNGTIGFDRIRKSVAAWVITFLFLMTVSFALKISAEFSRGTIFAFFLAGGVASCIGRQIVPDMLAGIAAANIHRGQLPIIISPTNHETQSLRLSLSERGYGDSRAIEFDEELAQTSGQREWIQNLVQCVLDTARTSPAGDIYLIPGKLSREVVDALLQRLRILPRAIYFVPEERLARLLQLEAQNIGGDLVIEMQKAPLSAMERRVKRLMDIAIGGLGLLAMGPFLFIVAILVKLDSLGPIFFTQERLGYRGRPFRILKFRTMQVMEDGETVAQAVQNDSRVTRLGRILRKTSIDELPQLLNVLKGEMSIVGPRPHAVAHDRLYSKLVENYELRQHVKPGITGWAQVHGLRGPTPDVELMYRRIEFDIWYATNCSLPLDAQIMLRTLFEVIRYRNAF
jgi:Undecaprenyl-phosphate glucose phosphotransferase